MKRQLLNSSIPFVIIIGMIMFLSTCKKDEDSSIIPEIFTFEINNITQTTASGGGIPLSDGGALITAKGLCWSTNQNHTINDSHTSDGNGMGDFTSSLSNLNPATTYYVVAYATNSAGTAYGKEFSFTTYAANAITDIDGNYYNIVNIGTQTWMAENLKTTHYSDGADIPNITDVGQWSGLSTGAYSYHNNYAANATTYGALYNWYAVVSSNNLCPTGWHVPSDAEWTILTNCLGGEIVAGGKLKTTGTTEDGTSLWYWPNVGATNESGFTALPVGSRDESGQFGDIGSFGYWWSSMESSVNYAWSRQLYHYSSNVYRYGYDKCRGFSVRCVRDY